MTNKEKEAIVKAAFPSIDDTSLPFAVYLVEDNDTIATYKNRVKEQPKVLAGTVFSPKDILKVAPAIAKGGKTVADLTKSIFTKKTAEKVAEETAKAGKKKLVTKKRVYTLGAGAAGVGIYNTVASGKTAIDPNASAAEIAAQDSFATAIANADAQGVDVTQFLDGTTAKQLGLNANNIGDFMAARGFVNPLSGLNNIGIFTGKEIETLVPRKKFGGTISVGKPEIVSLAEWKKSFPVDANGITAAKQKFVTAGVLDPTADLTQVKAAWDKYGQLSLDYARAGNKVSPWELLDIQKGLTGSGSQTTTTIDVSPMAEADIRTTAKRQLAQSLGLANVDDKMYKDILSIVRKKEAKNPTKSVRTTTGNTTRVKTTPGYGPSDVLADVEAYAKQDPRYAEFQTADVFGNAIVKALGLKS
jgi:hypothetical protein